LSNLIACNRNRTEQVRLIKVKQFLNTSLIICLHRCLKYTDPTLLVPKHPQMSKVQEVQILKAVLVSRVDLPSSWSSASKAAATFRCQIYKTFFLW